MHDALSLRVHSLRSVVASVVESGVVAEVVVRRQAQRPQHTRRCLVANLNPFDVDAVLLEEAKHVCSVVSHGSLHLLEVVLEVGPCSRNVLLARVSPRVRVVEVDHDTLTEILRAPRLCEHVLLIAPAVLRIYPHAESDRVHAEVAQQRHAVLLGTACIIELAASLLHFCEPAHVRALCKARHIIRRL